jgi:hypothetical protein
LIVQRDWALDDGDRYVTSCADETGVVYCCGLSRSADGMSVVVSRVGEGMEAFKIAGHFGREQHIIAAVRKKATSDSDNIRGSKLVKTVPPTLLKMNPNGTTQGENCIRGEDPVFLPIRVKGIPPF